MTPPASAPTTEARDFEDIPERYSKSGLLLRDTQTHGEELTDRGGNPAEQVEFVAALEGGHDERASEGNRGVTSGMTASIISRGNAARRKLRGQRGRRG